MHLKLVRTPSNEKCTIGTLFVDGVQECFILEDIVRDRKIYAKTAIPAGTYKVSLTYSPRFKTVLPLVENVPNYSGVRFHPGNTAEDTEGCLLPGRAVSADRFSVTQSRAAFAALFAKMQAAKSITLEIVSA